MISIEIFLEPTTKRMEPKIQRFINDSLQEPICKFSRNRETELPGLEETTCDRSFLATRAEDEASNIEFD